MWPFKKSNLQGQTLQLQISGMHCSACAMNIDNAVEEIRGVISSKTNYAKAETDVVFKPGKLNLAPVKKAIEALGYQVLHTPGV